MTHTLVAFHAHPDDEALLTSGTMARAAAEGHRVVVVVATDGDLGLASASSRRRPATPRSATRMAELRASAQALGVSRVEYLGYADSGLVREVGARPAGRGCGSCAPTSRRRPSGWRRSCARSTPTSCYLRPQRRLRSPRPRQGPRGRRPRSRRSPARRGPAGDGPARHHLPRAIDLAAKVYRFPPEFDRDAFDRAFSARDEITHRINVRRYAAAKRASMRAHASQASAEAGADRTLAAFLRIPRPLYDLVFGREWFVDPARPKGSRIATDIFEDLP